MNQALMVCGVLTVSLPNSNNASEIKNPQAMFGGPLPDGPIIGYDVFTKQGFNASAGNRCVAAWNETTSRYEFVDCEVG